MIIIKNLKEEYLIVGMDVYSEFKNYFNRNNYKKHQVVQSEAMIGMKCENIPIIEEV